MRTSRQKISAKATELESGDHREQASEATLQRPARQGMKEKAADAGTAGGRQAVEEEHT